MEAEPGSRSSVPFLSPLPCAMSGAFTPDMGAEALAAQLTAMRDELIARFQANEDEHERLRSATEAVKSEVSDLSGRLGMV